MKIKRAEHSDIPWISEELRVFSNSLNTKYSYFPPTEESLHQVLTSYVDDHVLLVAWDSGDRVGVIGGTSTLHPFNPNIRVLALQFWWVPERRRGSKIGYLLLRDFLKAGEDFNIVTVGFMDKGLINPRTFDGMGFSFREIAYVMEN